MSSSRGDMENEGGEGYSSAKKVKFSVSLKNTDNEGPGGVNSNGSNQKRKQPYSNEPSSPGPEYSIPEIIQKLLQADVDLQKKMEAEKENEILKEKVADLNKRYEGLEVLLGVQVAKIADLRKQLEAKNEKNSIIQDVLEGKLPPPLARQNLPGGTSPTENFILPGAIPEGQDGSPTPGTSRAAAGCQPSHDSVAEWVLQACKVKQERMDDGQSNNENEIVPPKCSNINRLNGDEDLVLLHSVDTTKNKTCSCNTKFFSKKSLSEHVRYHNQLWKFICQTCGEAFFKGAQLNYHIAAKHPGVEIPKGRGCTFCGDFFEVDVRMHQRSGDCEGYVVAEDVGEYKDEYEDEDEDR